MARIGYQDIKGSPGYSAAAIEALKAGNELRDKAPTSLQQVFSNFEKRKQDQTLGKLVSTSLQHPDRIGQLSAEAAKTGLLPRYAEEMTKMEELNALRQKFGLTQNKEQREQAEHELSIEAGRTALTQSEEKHPLEMESMRTDTGLRRAQTEGEEADTEARRTDTAVTQHGFEKTKSEDEKQAQHKAAGTSFDAEVAQVIEQYNVSPEDAANALIPELVKQGYNVSELAPYSTYLSRAEEQRKSQTKIEEAGGIERAKAKGEIEGIEETLNRNSANYYPGQQLPGNNGLVVIGGNGLSRREKAPTLDDTAMFIRSQQGIQSVIPGLLRESPSFKNFWSPEKVGTWALDPESKELSDTEKRIYNSFHQLRKLYSDEALTNRIQEAVAGSDKEIKNLDDFAELAEILYESSREASALKAQAVNGRQKLATPERDTSMPVSP